MITDTSALRVIIFDRYKTLSIKNNEYMQMQKDKIKQWSYTITAPEHARPTEFAKELRNGKFKEVIVYFHINHYSRNEIVPFLESQVQKLNLDNCYCFKVVDENIDKIKVSSLPYEEHKADTKNAYVCKITNDTEAVIRYPDILKILTFLLVTNRSHLLSLSLKVQIDNGSEVYQHNITTS